jgi:hypothetical protein
MALRISAMLFLAVFVGTGDARRVRNNAGDEVIQDRIQCISVLKPQYCPLFEHDHWLIDAMVGKEPAYWECMVKYAGEPGNEQCQKVKDVLTEQMQSYKGGHNSVTATKLAKFREILKLPEDESATPPALPGTKPWEKEKAAEGSPFSRKAEPTSVEAGGVSSAGGHCWCPAITRSEAHIGGFEKKRKQDLFTYNAEEKLGAVCGDDCQNCYNAVKAAVVPCCESNADGEADSNKCAPRWTSPAWEEKECICGGLSSKKSALFEKQSLKTCWPNSPCYPKTGVAGSCCPM